MASNFVELEGVIVKGPTRTQSPAGVQHCHFVIEHRSQQLEADLPRQVYMRIQVIASGLQTQQMTQDIVSGDTVYVSGFLTQHEARNGLSKLVLHARNIERKN